MRELFQIFSRFSVYTMIALLVLDVLLHKVEMKLQVRQKLKRGRQASVFFKPRETWTLEFLCLSCCRQDVVLFFITCP